MSEPNAVQNVQDVPPPEEADAEERVEELTRTWESSPLTDPVEAQDPDAKRIQDHGDTDVEDERIAQRPDF
jgi:hypothetical protein